MQSNARRAVRYYTTLAALVALVLGLVGLAVFAMIPDRAASAPITQIDTEPLRQYEIGQVARFVVGGGAVHQGPIIAHRLTAENQWVYDVSFPATDGGEGSVWESLEEYRILLVTEDSQLYQPRVEGYPVKLVDPATGLRIIEGVTEGIVQGGERIGGSWHYHLLTNDCEVIRPPEGLTIVLVNNTIEPITCGEILACPTPAKSDKPEPPPTDKPRRVPDPDPTATPEPTPTPTLTPNPTPEPTATPTLEPTPETTPTSTLEPETPTPTPTPEPDPDWCWFWCPPTPEPTPTPTPEPDPTPTEVPPTPTPEPTDTPEPPDEGPDGTDGVTGSDTVEP